MFAVLLFVFQRSNKTQEEPMTAWTEHLIRS